VVNLDPPAISAAATAQNWKIWRDLHSVPVSLGSRKYSAISNVSRAAGVAQFPGGL
jgi:hypothetical protein